MMSDLSRFLRAVKLLAKLAWKYDHEDFVEALGRYATVKQESDVAFAGDFLFGIGTELNELRAHFFRCRECDGKINIVRRDDQRDARANARYCSPKCRQKAYRKRVADRTEKQKTKRNESGVSLRLAPRERAPAVTAGPPIAPMTPPSEKKEALAT